MTLSPTTPVRGVSGKLFARNEICAVPGCISRSQHGHHIWPRSHLRGQPYDWVTPEDGQSIGNVIGLCIRHHEDVTGDVGGHRARIQFDPETRAFFWLKVLDTVVVNEGYLWPQPPGAGEVPAPEPPPPLPHSEEHTDHGVLVPGQTCPSCGYTKPRKRIGLPPRKVKEWTVMVPADSEIGADVLDSWIEEFGAIMGLELGSKRLLRYHVLATVLAWAAQNQPAFIRDVREAGEN